MIKDQENAREGNQFYQISVVSKGEKNMGKVRIDSVVGLPREMVDGVFSDGVTLYSLPCT